MKIQEDIANQKRVKRMVKKLLPCRLVYNQYIKNSYSYCHILKNSNIDKNSIPIQRIELIFSDLFRKNYLVAFVNPNWLSRVAPGCNAAATPCLEFEGLKSPPIVLVSARAKFKKNSSMHSIIEHEFVHINQALEAWDYWASTNDILLYLEAAKSESQWFYVYASLSLNLGIRIGEALALDIEDVNLSHRRIHIHKVFEETSATVHHRTKGHKERWLGLNDSLHDVLVERFNRTELSLSHHPLICDDNGDRIRERKVRHIHDRICSELKLKCIRLHDLRHTYASHYVMNGGSLVELQSLLGHSNPMMTLKYAHLAPGYLEKKAGVVSFSIAKQNILPLKKVR